MVISCKGQIALFCGFFQKFFPRPEIRPREAEGFPRCGTESTCDPGTLTPSLVRKMNTVACHIRTSEGLNPVKAGTVDIPPLQSGLLRAVL